MLNGFSTNIIGQLIAARATGRQGSLLYIGHILVDDTSNHGTPYKAMVQWLDSTQNYTIVDRNITDRAITYFMSDNNVKNQRRLDK